MEGSVSFCANSERVSIVLVSVFGVWSGDRKVIVAPGRVSKNKNINIDITCRKILHFIIFLIFLQVKF